MIFRFTLYVWKTIPNFSDPLNSGSLVYILYNVESGGVFSLISNKVADLHEVKLDWNKKSHACQKQEVIYMRYPLDFGDLKTLETFIQNVVNKDAVYVFRDCKFQKFLDPYVA